MKKIFLVIVVGFIVVFSWYKFSLTAVGGSEMKNIKIEAGSSLSSIAETLESEGIIRSDSAFSLFARLHGKQSSLKAGTFVLSPSMNIPGIIELLDAGQSGEVSITIPEGFTVSDVDALLAEKGLGQPGDIIHCAFACDFSSYAFITENIAAEEKGYGSKLEGYVFPDTYFVSSTDYVPKFFLERTLNAFRSKVVEGLSADLRSSNKSPHQILTMASLIEKETITDAERSIVSGILWKRFDINMGLGVDATVRYPLKKPTGALTSADLDVESDYNTRKYAGLPPGPIANPGLKSIQAAINPAPTEYLYYLHDPSGQIHYAKTNDEHNENKRLYLR